MMQIRIRKKERETRYIQTPWTITLSFVVWNIYCLTFSIPDLAEERFRVCSGFEAAVKYRLGKVTGGFFAGSNSFLLLVSLGPVEDPKGLYLALKLGNFFPIFECF